MCAQSKCVLHLPQAAAGALCCVVCRCVFMRVSSWWRAVSERCVYAGGNCDPSLDGVVTQVPACSLVQSSLLTYLSFMAGGSGKSLQISPAWKKSGSAFTHFEKHAFELERKKYPAAAGDVLAAHNSINENVALIKLADWKLNQEWKDVYQSRSLFE